MMTIRGKLWLSAAAISIAVLAAAPFSRVSAQQSSPPGVTVGPSDLGGVVTGPSGPEAGVWVIAETTDLPTKFAKIVVTDDQGRYVIPDLPKANYSVWVRGYGLVDSPKVQARRASILDLKAVPAPNATAAAQYYPPIYWFSMIHVPKKDEFPLPKIKSQGEWLNIVKSGACQSCHPLGTPGTRTISQEFSASSRKPSDAWTRRLAIRQRADVHGARHRPSRHRQGARPVRRLDRPHRRAANCRSPSPSGRRASSATSSSRLWDWGQPDVLSARRGLDRPPQSAAQRQRQDLRLAGGQHRHDPDPRSGDQHRERGASIRCAIRRRRTPRTTRSRRRRTGATSRSGTARRSTTTDARREGPRLVHAAHPPARQSRFLQGGLRSSVGEGLPARRRRTGSCRSTIRRPASSR